VGKRVVEQLADFTAPNLMAVMRIFGKRPGSSDVLTQVAPRLRELLADYEATELTDMLVSMAMAQEAAGDMDILMTLVPEVERRYAEVSLVHAINNLWALTQLKVVHQSLLARVAADLNDAQKTRDLTPPFMARIAWVYRRCQAWDSVSSAMLPLILGSTADFKCGDFARLAQALPEEQVLLSRIAGVLQPSVSEMGRKDFLFFLLACVHGQLLEDAATCRQGKGKLVDLCMDYIREEQDNFKPLEIDRIVRLFGYSSHKFLLDHLPPSWNATKESTLDHMMASA